MRVSLTLAAFVFTTAASATPTSSALNACSSVSVIVSSLHACSSATPFCSSFLHIPTVTSTVTTTSTAIVPSSQTSTTGTVTITSTAIATSISSTTVTTCSTGASVVPRAVLPSTTTGHSTTTLKTTTQCSETPLPSCGLSFQSAQISTACGCLAIPTPTSTLTSTIYATSVTTIVKPVAATATATATATVVLTSTITSENCPAPTLCGNQGLQWAFYNNTNGDNPSIGSGYPNFHPEDYKTAPPVYTAITNSIGGIDEPVVNQIISIYGSPAVFFSDYFILNHRGYIFAQQSGNYTFSVSNVDDAVSIWVGPNAYSGWTRANDNLDVAIGPSQGTYTTTLTAGHYYPIRVVFAQAQVSAEFQMSISAPDHTVFLSNVTQGSPYLVQYSCDQTTAPPYAEPFGAET